MTPGVSKSLTHSGPDHFPRILSDDASRALWFIRCLDQDCTATTTTPIEANASKAPGQYGAMITMGDDHFPRIVYADNGTDEHVHYVRCTNDDCTSPVNTDLGVDNYDGYQVVSIAIGQDHFARLTYQDNNDATLRLLRCTNDDCTSPVNTIVDNRSSNIPAYNAQVIRMGSDGFARIAYVDENSPYTLHYAVCNDDNCTSPTITDLANTDANISYEDGHGFALRSGDLASISYEDTSFHLHVINCSNVSCSSNNDVTVDTLPNRIKGGSSLVIGPDNLPRVAYSDRSTGTFYARLGTLDGLNATGGSSLGTSNSPFGSVNTKALVLNGTTFSSASDLSPWATNGSVISYNGGNVGVATDTPWRTLSVTGTVGLDGLTGATGAGSLCLSANKQVVYNSGSDNCLSSLRSTKHDINNLEISGTTTVAALTPVSFIYNNDASSTVRYGFIAEDTAAVDSHLATYDQSGKLSGVDDRSILSILGKALQEIIATIAGFAQSFTSHQVNTDKLCVKKSDGTPVCITGDQLTSMLASTGQSPSNPVQISTGSFTIASSSPSSNEGTTTSTTTDTVIIAASSTPPTSPPTDKTTSAATSTSQ